MLFLLAVLAVATPAEVTQQGRLLDAFGVGVNGEHTASFALYDDSLATTVLYTTGDMTLDFVDGYYAVKLGPLASQATSASELWVQITVDDSALEPLQQLGAVPFALSAQAPPESVAWGALSGMPTDFADGNDAVLTEAQVDNYVANNGFLTEANWAAVQGIPAAFADGVDDTLSEPQVDGMVSNNGYLTSVQWNQVQGTPSGFSDGVDNTLSEPQVDSMVSDNGYVTSVSNGAWTSTLSGGNGGQWGSWSNWQWCPSDTFMCGMRTKVEGDQGFSDDTSMNDIQIACCRIQQ
ncbi:MAG: hypothetical protein ACJAZO_002631 [Myxococcota bacterium]|jgi:hypothetical protein